MQKTIAILFILISLSALADTTPLRIDTNKQRNSWAIEVDEDLGSEVTEESFYAIITKVFALYANNEMGRKLELGIVDWKVPYMSAWAFETDKAFTINFWGGFARIPGMTDRALALTVCHEIGHIIGGSPYHLPGSSQNMSAEGQSDFFAASTCMKKYISFYEIQDEVTALDAVAASRCFERFEKLIEREVCFEITKAAQDLASVFSFLNPEQGFSFETPSELIVPETLFNSYPTIQCRLDTFLAGALAATPLPIDEELRPACWFAKEIL
ncbi:MAG: hypothetical protein ACJAT2_001527 [Bacteriovoracaceae bacterium]|jgi:hypothetical protein